MTTGNGPLPRGSESSPTMVALNSAVVTSLRKVSCSARALAGSRARASKTDQRQELRIATVRERRPTRGEGHDEPAADHRSSINVASIRQRDASAPENAPRADTFPTEKGRPVSRAAFPVLRRLHIDGRFQDRLARGLSPGLSYSASAANRGSRDSGTRTDAMVSHLRKMR